MAGSTATKSKPKPKAVKKKSTASSKSAGRRSTGEAMSVFQVIAGLEKALQRPVARNLVSVYASKADKTVSNELAKLKSKGHVEYDAKTIRLTLAGKKTIGSSIPTIVISQDATLLRMKKQHNLTKKECVIVDILSNGRPHNKKEVMEKTEFIAKKTFDNTLGKLKRLEIVEYTDSSRFFQLTEKMFPFGRPPKPADTTATPGKVSSSSLATRLEIAKPIRKLKK
jgi:hypothetical protein